MTDAAGQPAEGYEAPRMSLSTAGVDLGAVALTNLGPGIYSGDVVLPTAGDLGGAGVAAHHGVRQPGADGDVRGASDDHAPVPGAVAAARTQSAVPSPVTSATSASLRPSAGASTAACLDGAFFAGAFFAGVFFAVAFLAGAFLRGGLLRRRLLRWGLPGGRGRHRQSSASSRTPGRRAATESAPT